MEKLDIKEGYLALSSKGPKESLAEYSSYML